MHACCLCLCVQKCSALCGKIRPPRVPCIAAEDFNHLRRDRTNLATRILSSIDRVRRTIRRASARSAKPIACETTSAEPFGRHRQGVAKCAFVFLPPPLPLPPTAATGEKERGRKEDVFPSFCFAAPSIVPSIAARAPCVTLDLRLVVVVLRRRQLYVFAAGSGRANEGKLQNTLATS